MSDKQSNDNNQELKIAQEGNDSTFETKEQIKEILKKKQNKSNTNNNTTQNTSTNEGK